MALEAPFLSQPVPLGISGLDLKRSVDQVPPQNLVKMTNVIRNNIGEITSRPGLTAFASAGGPASVTHSISRIDDPLTGNSRIIVGVSNSIFQGTTGALALVEGGFSGNPLSLTTYRPPLSGQAWMFVADDNKVRKIRSTDALSLQIGLAPPAAFAVAPTAAVAQITTIDTFEVANWTNNQGTGAGLPTNALDLVNFKVGAASVQFASNVAGAAYNFWCKTNAQNLDTVGVVDASDEDLMHFWLRTDLPAQISEVRLYFVCSTPFDTGVLPGTSTASPPANSDAYVKAFRSSDFTPVYEATAATIPTAATVNTTAQTLQQLAVTPDDRAAIQPVIQQTEPSRGESVQTAPGRVQWTEFGALGRPVRRGDFRRIGSDTTRDWGNVTGVVIMVSTIGATNVNVWFDDLSLRGGSGPDTTPVGTQAYDYRCTNYDSRTGAESNPSPIMAESIWVDALRQSINVTPNTYGDANIVQRVYRRGGALTNNWYFVGTNAADGGLYVDTASDLSIIASATLETDNDQPITTVDSTGTTVTGIAPYSMWGPLQDILFACGDPYRPGFVYWSKTGEPDSWPAANSLEVTSTSEPLQTGVVWGSQSFVFSRLRMFTLYPNLSGAGTMVATPTACGHGPISRWAVAVGPGAIYFVSNDGVYSTQGGAETNLTDDTIRSLFYGETRNGYAPIDFTRPTAIRLFFHLNELWMLYPTSPGGSAVTYAMIFNIADRYWRHYQFGPAIIGPPIYSGYSDVRSTSSNLLLGSNDQTFTHSGTSDNTLPIFCNFSTAALDQGAPRQDKVYGDVIVDADRASTTITIVPQINNRVTALAALTLTTGSSRTRYTLDPFGTGPQQARNISFDFEWNSSANRPIIYLLAPSYVVQPDTTVTRYSDWSVEGRRTDKYVKGLILECDTSGAAKTVDLEADGVVQTTITATATGRQVLQFSFAQFRGRELRIHPTDSNNWKVYAQEWIFDEEPLQLVRWETQEVNHGIPIHHALLAGLISLKSTADVTLTITGIRQTGATFSDAYTITSTAGLKLKPFVPFNARKAVLWKYVFTSAAAFWLYREESEVVVVPWGGEPVTAHPFGSDDLDRVRSMSSAALVAAAAGGGQS